MYAYHTKVLACLCAECVIFPWTHPRPLQVYVGERVEVTVAMHNPLATALHLHACMLVCDGPAPELAAQDVVLEADEHTAQRESSIIIIIADRGKTTTTTSSS